MSNSWKEPPTPPSDASSSLLFPDNLLWSSKLEECRWKFLPTSKLRFFKKSSSGFCVELKNRACLHDQANCVTYWWFCWRGFTTSYIFWVWFDSLQEHEWGKFFEKMQINLLLLISCFFPQPLQAWTTGHANCLKFFILTMLSNVRRIICIFENSKNYQFSRSTCLVIRWSTSCSTNALIFSEETLSEIETRLFHFCCCYIWVGNIFCRRRRKRRSGSSVSQGQQLSFVSLLINIAWFTWCQSQGPPTFWHHKCMWSLRNWSLFCIGIIELWFSLVFWPCRCTHWWHLWFWVQLNVEVTHVQLPQFIKIDALRSWSSRVLEYRMDSKTLQGRVEGRLWFSNACPDPWMFSGTYMRFLYWFQSSFKFCSDQAPPLYLPHDCKTPPTPNQKQHFVEHDTWTWHTWSKGTCNKFDIVSIKYQRFLLPNSSLRKWWKHIPMLKLYILLYLSVTWQVLISRHSKITTSVFSRWTQIFFLQSSSSSSRAAVLILFYVCNQNPSLQISSFQDLKKPQRQNHW